MMQPEFTPEALLAHSDWVRRLVFGMVRDPGRTEDVLQETWMAALQNPPRGAVNLRAWLATVARNMARKNLRGDNRRALREQAAARLEALPDTVDVISKARLQGRMVEAVLRLEEPYRTSILLRFFEELAPREIAKRLDRPVNTVQSHIQRGLAQLRSELDSEYGDRETWGMAFLPLLWKGKAKASGATLLTSVGGASVVAKYLAILLFIFVGFLSWNQWSQRGSNSSTLLPLEQDPDQSTLESLAAATEILQPVDNGRQDLLGTSTSAAPVEAPVAVHAYEGTVVDTQGRAMPGIALLLSDPDLPQIQDGWIGEVGTGIEITHQLIERLKSEDNPSLTHEGRTLIGSDIASLLRALENGPPRTVSDSDGHFTVDAPFKRAKFACEQEHLSVAGSGVFLTESGAEEFICVVAQSATVRGRVVDSAGNPLEGVEVGFHSGIEYMAGFPRVKSPPSFNSVPRRTQTDRAGNFQFPTAAYLPGSWLSASLMGYVYSGKFLPTTPLGNLEITLAERTTRPLVSGIVIDSSGLPVPGAKVCLTHTEVQVNGLGQFEFEAPYLLDGKPLLAYAKGLAPAVNQDFSTRLNADSSCGQNLVLRLGAPTKSIHGRIQDAAGSPLPGMQIKVRGALFDGSSSRSIEERGAPGWAWDITSDGEGQFTIDGLFQESYDLDAFDPGSFLAAGVDGVVPGTRDVVITLDPKTRIPLLKGRVVDSHGQGVHGAVLTSTFATHISDGHKSWTSKELGTADEDGYFELENVPTETVGLRASGLHVEGVDVDLTGWHGRALAGESMEILVSLELHFQLSQQAVAGATRFRVLEESGAPTMFSARSTGLTAGFSRDYRIKPNVPLPTFVVGTSASELVLYNGDTFLRRIPLDLKRGEITQLN